MGPEVLQYLSTVEIISLAHEAFEDLLPQESELKITVGSGGDGGEMFTFLCTRTRKCHHFARSNSRKIQRIRYYSNLYARY